MSTCPRCMAEVLPENMPAHIDWHRGVPDGYHAFALGQLGPDRCSAESRFGSRGAFHFCSKAPDHRYHQPLPKVVEE